MVPISASELYSGVEKKVFVFPRPPLEPRVAAAREASACRLMICRGCKEDPSRLEQRNGAPEPDSP